MRRKTMSELFGEVAPELKVINRDSYHHQRSKRLISLDEKLATEAYHYERHTSTDKDWEKTAITCSVCGQPTARFLSSLRLFWQKKSVP